MNPLLREYYRSGFVTREQILAAARSRGTPALLDAMRALSEDATRQNSTAMIVVPGEPPGKNVCEFIRKLATERTKLIVVAQSGRLAPGNFERLLRSSMPDCEKKLRIMDGGSSLADAVSSAERNHHYRPSQVLEVFCGDEESRLFAQEIRDGSLKFDPTVITVNPTEIPTDDVDAILKAVHDDDLDAMHRMLDPHVFSDQNSLGSYKDALFKSGGAGLLTVGGSSQHPPKKESRLREGIRKKFPGEKLYVHFSARPEEPKVPPKAINFLAGSGGPLGVYAWALDPRAMTFASERPYAFVLRPTVEVTDVRAYTADRVEVDIQKLSAWVDLTRPLKLWERFKKEASGRIGPPFYKLWFLLSKMPAQWQKDTGEWEDDEEDIPGLSDTSFGDKRRGAKFLIDLGHKAIYDDIGIIYASEPMQVVFLTDDSFEVVDTISDPTGFSGKTSSLVEFLTDIAPSRELGIAKLDALLRSELGDSFDELEYLGSGRNGSAYKTPDGFIVKVTTDSAEAYSAEQLRGLECEYIHRIHVVTQMAENVWVILQEGGLEKLPPQYAEEFDLAMEILETIGAGHALRAGDAAGVLETMIRCGHTDLCTLVSEVMEKFGVGGMLREVGELGLSADFHSGNIMLREGRPILTDLGTPGDDPNEDKKGPPKDGRQVSELAGTTGALPMRSSNSSAWAGGRLVLSKPEQHVPEDENETEGDRGLDKDMVGGGLDWGSRAGY